MFLFMHGWCVILIKVWVWVWVWWRMAAPPAEHYSSRGERGWTLKSAVPWHFFQLLDWSVSVDEDDRDNCLRPLWHAASLTVHRQVLLQGRVQHWLQASFSVRSLSVSFLSEYLEPNQINSVLLALSCSLLDELQFTTSDMQSSSWRRADQISRWYMKKLLAWRTESSWWLM